MAVNNVDLSGLKRFKKVLKETLKTNQDNSENRKIEKISTMAYDEIMIAYSGTKFEVMKPQIYNAKATIYVKGEDIAFDEFGTGLYAKGSYNGNLPKQPIFFESVGFPQVTLGWDYYYTWKGDPLKNPKKEINGVSGWFTNKESGIFHIGKDASNRFYNAVQRIKNKVKENK